MTLSRASFERSSAHPTPPHVREAHLLARSADPYIGRLTEDEHAALKLTLVDDLTSEFDARFLKEYLGTLSFELPSAFREVIERWEFDEQQHFLGSYEMAVRHFGFDPELLHARTPDFGPLAHLFRGPFEILVLLAYDELVTVRGYRGNFEAYSRLGPRFGAWMHRVAADEARHDSEFLGLLREHLPGELGRTEEVLAAIRATEGQPYRATFVLDHDDPVYNADLFDEASRLLLRQLQRS